MHNSAVFRMPATMQSYYSDQSVIKESVLWNRACDVLMETATVNVKEAETGDE